MGRGRLAASHGIQQAISTPAPPKPAPQTAAQQAPVYHKVNWLAHQTIMHEMGQDGTEGKGYVHTSRAYVINRYLRNGGDFEDALEAAPGWGNWFTESEARHTIKTMDSKMKPLTRNLQGVRFVGTSFLASLGLSEDAPLGVAAEILKTRISLGHAEFSDKGFSSFSTNVEKNYFTSRPIKINYSINKGTKTIMTANHEESEGIIARGVKQRITAARVVHGKLEIDVEV